ncbi:MAG: SGNH/GDSL hydrolase family protein [Candidatus Korobacteraceae bacterium]
MPAIEPLTNKPVEPSATKSNRMGWPVKLLISVVWLALLLEIAPRLFLATNLLIHQRVRRAVLGDDNSSWRLYWVFLHRIHEEWTGKYSAYHPTRGWAVMPDIKNMTPFGKGKFVNTNSKGLRSNAEYEYAPTPGKQRILVLGDSFTFGTDVSDDETYSHDLESALPNTEVLNLGVQGYGQDQMLLYLKEEGVKYRPEIVILGFAYMDTNRNLWKFFAFAKPKFEAAPDGLKLTNVPVPMPEQVLAEEPYRSKALDSAIILREKIRWKLGMNERQAKELTTPILNDIVATTRSIGAVPVFVYLPAYEEVDDLSDSMSERERYLYDYCQARNLACLFLRPRFVKAARNGVKLESHFHWTADMHKMAAEEIANFLVARGLVQEPPVSVKNGGQLDHTQ